MTISQLVNLEWRSILESLYMVICSTGLSYIIGIPLGVILCVTDKTGIHPNRPVNAVLGVITNLLRSVPFLILLVVIQPITRAIVGTTIGPTAIIVPLVFSASPYVGRLVESSLKEVDRLYGLIACSPCDFNGLLDGFLRFDCKIVEVHDMYVCVEL